MVGPSWLSVAYEPAQRCQRLRPLILASRSVEISAFAGAYVQVYVAAAFLPLNELAACKTLA